MDMDPIVPAVVATPDERLAIDTLLRTADAFDSTRRARTLGEVLGTLLGGDAEEASWARAELNHFGGVQVDLYEQQEPDPDLEWLAAALVERHPELARELLPEWVRYAQGFIPGFEYICTSFVATWMIDAYQKPTQRPLARRWMRRHPSAAGRTAVAGMLSSRGKRRARYEFAVRGVVAECGRTVIDQVGEDQGPLVATALQELLSDPLAFWPAEEPDRTFAENATLPQVRRAGSDEALSDAERECVVRLFAASPPDVPHPAVSIIRSELRADDLADLGLALFRLWQDAGAAAAGLWTVRLLGEIGDDEAARQLAPVIEAWPGQRQHKRAMVGLAALESIGTPVAMLHLTRIATQASFDGIRNAALERLTRMADALGISQEALEDQLVPDFGLSHDAPIVLDYGSRQFTVVLDERLRPMVREAGGARLVGLPRRRKADDKAKVAHAKATLKRLQSDLATISHLQLARLERAMMEGRRWELTGFRQHVAEHPVMGHLATRLVWGVYDDEGRLLASVRVDESRALVSVDDEGVHLPDDARIGIAHPADLPDRQAWSALFADYEILQPFEQLLRPAFDLTEEEAANPTLERHRGASLNIEGVYALHRRGWEVRRGLSRLLPHGHRARIDVLGTLEWDRGKLHMGSVEPKVGALAVYESRLNEAPLIPLASLLPAIRSELVGDYQRLV